MTLLVAGGAGFIGANFIADWLSECDETIVNLDKLTYAGNLENLTSLKHNNKHIFVQGDISDCTLVSHLFAVHQPRGIINFAAESHVDRSIAGPADFITTNIVGTFRLLECALHYYKTNAAKAFRFLQVSTDEVYGSLNDQEPAFTEQHRFQPNSP